MEIEFNQCLELKKKYEEESKINNYRIFGKISETEFYYFKCRYYEAFKDTNLEVIYFHLDHIQFNKILSSHDNFDFLYIYFVLINGKRSLVFKFTNRDNLAEDLSMNFDEIHYLLKDDKLVAYKDNLKNDVDNFRNSFKDIFNSKIGNYDITIYNKNNLSEKEIYPHYITLHLLLNEQNKITLGMQINIDSIPVKGTYYLDRGAWFP